MINKLSDLITDTSTLDELTSNLSALDDLTLQTIKDMVDHERYHNINLIRDSKCTCADDVTHLLTECRADTTDLDEVTDDLLTLSFIGTALSKINP